MRWLDLVPAAGEVSGLSDLAPRPEEVGRFLIELFDLWFWDQDRQVDFKELRQEVKMALQPEINLGDPFHKKRCDFRRLIFAPDGMVFSCDQWVNDATDGPGRYPPGFPGDHFDEQGPSCGNRLSRGFGGPGNIWPVEAVNGAGSVSAGVSPA